MSASVHSHMRRKPYQSHRPALSFNHPLYTYSLEILESFGAGVLLQKQTLFIPYCQDNLSYNIQFDEEITMKLPRV